MCEEERKVKAKFSINKNLFKACLMNTFQRLFFVSSLPKKCYLDGRAI